MNDANIIIDQVAGILDDDAIHYERLADGQAIKSGFKGKNGKYQVVIGADDDPPLLFLSVRIPLLIPEQRRSDVAEAIVRINQNLPLGRFDLDMTCGDVAFYASIPLLDSSLSTAQFRATAATAFRRADEYYRCFGRLLFDNDLTPAAAVAEIEMAMSRGQ